jgi:hypothetical protein
MGLNELEKWKIDALAKPFYFKFGTDYKPNSIIDLKKKTSRLTS